MLSTNVLCMKKRKKRTYSFSNNVSQNRCSSDTTKRSSSGAVTMLQITEDTPPDMLAGAMDLTVHLPSGQSVKMAVERSTPMMDLLVQITTNHQLQLSGYTLQALSMAPSSEHTDRILPYKPNTPIGALDTQHIKVIPKQRTLPVQKNPPPGHQPFESTFRLKVHLPRNQLYVIRVSRNVLLEDIMRKVCEEKNLDPIKYEFKHPGNLDQVLDPKLTLSDYQITEIYMVAKGTINQAFSTSDIMALRKEEERKQMHTKTGGGVFNLIFRRGKSSMGSGSLSSENRSISPTQSDDSRSVTPPTVQPPILSTIKQEINSDKPKPPQRKRRPAPKPPQQSNIQNNETIKRKTSEEKPPSSISLNETTTATSDDLKKVDSNGITICHSRNSSDSSGYHEASVLSDNCNTSLPRRPKSAYINGDTVDKIGQMHNRSTTNLTQMSSHSKSTSSLAFAGRKKKAAPPPPPTLKSSTSVADLSTTAATPSPVVVASQPLPVISQQEESLIEQRDIVYTANTNPIPAPRRNNRPAPPIPRPRSVIVTNTEEIPITKSISTEKNNESYEKTTNNSKTIEELYAVVKKPKKSPLVQNIQEGNSDTKVIEQLETKKYVASNIDDSAIPDKQSQIDNVIPENPLLSPVINQEVEELSDLNDQLENKPPTDHIESFYNYNEPEELLDGNFLDKIEKSKLSVKPPEVVALIPKSPSTKKYDTLNRKQYFQRGSGSLNQSFDSNRSSVKSSDYDKNLSSNNSVISTLDSCYTDDDEIEDLDENLFTESSKLKKSNKKNPETYDQLFGIHSIDKDLNLKKNTSTNSLHSVNSIPGFLNGNLKKWNNIEDLDEISSSEVNDKWVIGDTSDSESIISANVIKPTIPTPLLNNDITTEPSNIENSINKAEVAAEFPKTESEEPIKVAIEPPKEFSEPSNKAPSNELELNELDWQYQLPSPPKAFRDTSPANFTDITNDTQSVTTDFKDSVVTSPELFEKLKAIEDVQSERETVSDLQSVISEDDNKSILNKLSLEHLEKRKSLVYNRELATSLKMTDLEEKQKSDTFSSSLTTFENTYNEIKQNNVHKEDTFTTNLRKTNSVTMNKTSTLPNFKITTYDNPKKNIKVFEDDTIRSNTNDTYRNFNSFVETEKSTLTRNFVGRSMENISYRKNSFPDENKKEETEYKFYRPQEIQKSSHVNGVSRSESFSTEQNNWSPSKPVSRSKSHITLNKYNVEKSGENGEENLTKSNSLFDVSGLQSLEVMKLIQNKLNTPTTSVEELDKKQEEKPVPPKVEEKPAPKTYQYRGPPSINMGTWSERPKVPVSVKEDADYKLSNHVSSKLIVNTTNNNITSSNSIEVKSNTTTTQISNSNTKPQTYYSTIDSSKNVSVKINGTEPISSQKSGNVIIKIGPNNNSNKILDNQRFISHTTAVGYRRPFTDLNSAPPKQRPHSIALDSNFDISRVPVVRSVELKKPFKDIQNNNNTSITHINNNYTPNGYNSIEPVNNFPTIYKNHDNGFLRNFTEPKPFVNTNSFKSVPTVRGFKPVENNNQVNNNRLSWNPQSNINNTFNTLPNKPKTKDVYSTNRDVPFGQSHLRRTESNKIANSNNKEEEARKTQISFINQKNNFNSLPHVNLESEIIQPPPPPQMPKIVRKPTISKPVEMATDPRAELLSAIRNFGGKKGLKTTKT